MVAEVLRKAEAKGWPTLGIRGVSSCTEAGIYSTQSSMFNQPF